MEAERGIRMAQFNEGDIVQLKSGGPKMTCSGEHNPHAGYLCKWFAGSKLEQGYFQSGMLKTATDEKPAKAK
jgi:uncharacterized protein YodC (DUF2158 family)